MLSSKGFDLWADGYDRAVGLSDEDGTYPFAGYKGILGEIYDRVLASNAKSVLDIGFGTGTLTTRLCEHGLEVYGQDFSQRMIELAAEKMPGAKLYQGDFSQGLVRELTERKYDAIVATYSLHHLTDGDKVNFIRGLQDLLTQDGRIYIGDVAFADRSQLDRCRAEAGDEWDDEEIYFVIDELTAHFPDLTFTPFSLCAGVMTMGK